MTEREELKNKLSCASEIADKVYELDIPMSEKTAYFDKVNDLERELLAFSSVRMNRRAEG